MKAILQKRLVVFIFVFVIPSICSAQDICDPNDRIYTYFTLWEENGILYNLPNIRPYPAQLIKSLLEEVVLNGTARDREIASGYLTSIFNRKLLRPQLEYTGRFGNDGYYMDSGINLKFASTKLKLLSFYFNAGLLLFFVDHGLLMPKNTYSELDYLEEWGDINVGKINFSVWQSFYGAMGIGNEKCYFQTGLIRSTYGPFYDNGAILGPQAPESGHFSLTYRGKRLVITSMLLALVATTNEGDGKFPNKFFAFHSINFNPAPWLEIGGFETVIYGDRFDPVYLLPLVQKFYSQSFFGVKDNSLFGITLKFKLPAHVKIQTQVYIDDIHFNDLARFDFKTKYKLSWQIGLVWTPSKKILKRISLDYLLITPYTYTHRNYDDGLEHEDPNYLNYTHKGVNLGPSLEPNSDRWTLSVMLTPASWLDLLLKAAWIRHGNASEGVTDGSGDLFDDGYDNGTATFQDETRFLSQDVLEHILQFGLDGNFLFAFKWANFSVSAGYTLEVILNSKLNKGETDINHYGRLSLRLLF
jgi:hypothetical protein